MRRKGMLFLTMFLFCLGLFKFNVDAAVMINNGTYNILSALNNNKAVDVSGAGKVNGTNIQLWDCVDEFQQQFIFTRVTGTYYRITDVNSGKVLDVAGGVRKSGVNVQLYQYNGSAAQFWKLEPAGNGYYYIKSKLGYYLDVSGASTANGTNIQVYSLNRTKAQKFKLRATRPYTLISENIYIFQSALNNQKVIDVAGAGTQNTTNIQLWDSNNTNAQKYRVQPVAQGYYKIVSVISGRVLDVAGGVRKSGVNVQLFDYNGSDAQLWRFYSAGNGYYYVKNKLGYYMDVSGAGINNGTNIQVYSGNSTNAQKFKLKVTEANLIVNPNPVPVITGFDPIWPLSNSYVITTLYRYSNGNKHSTRYQYGIDMAAPKGENVLAVESGTVICSEYSTTSGFGNWIKIQHSNGKVSLYAHLDSRSVKKGDRVVKGQIIGYVGNTSAKYKNLGYHLHFELGNKDVSGAAGDAWAEYYKTKYGYKVSLQQAAKKYPNP